MEAVEHNQKDANTRWEAQSAPGGKTVRLQLPVLESTNKVLLVLIVAIQRREIQIGRCQGRRPIIWVCLE